MPFHRNLLILALSLLINAVVSISTTGSSSCGAARMEGPSVSDFDSVPIDVLTSDGTTVSFTISNSLSTSETANLFVTINKGMDHQCLEFEAIRSNEIVGEILTTRCHHMNPEALVHVYVDAENLDADLDKEEFESSVCCNAMGGHGRLPKKKYTLVLPCDPCGGTYKRNLQEEIIKDMMPESSTQCSPTPANTSYSFESSQAESQWWEPFADFEQDVFLAKMQHQDESSNRSWTVRFGQAGNIYSLVGPMGETVPPQRHQNAPWVDEVWQAVQPLGPGGDNDGDPSTDRYFIHEAGTYQRDGDYTKTPVYSPSLGKYCSEHDGECGFVSWGQQAHVPTPWTSDMLYLNRYVNCGNGVFEYTTMRHNNVGSADSFGYLNVPWGGARNTVLKDIVLTHYERGLEVQYPLKSFGESELRGLGDTLGFSIFAEDLPKYAPEHLTPYPVPSGLNLTVGGECYDEGSHSVRFVCPLVPQSVDVGYQPNMAEPGLIVQLDGAAGRSVTAGVRHWSAAGDRMFLYKGDDFSIEEIKEAFPVGTTMSVRYFLPPDGKPEEDNLGLMHVHGGQDLPKGRGYPRVRAGAAGRDFNVYTINTVPSIQSGDTYFYRQYFAVDSYGELEATGKTWAPEAFDEQYAAGERNGRRVTLYSDGESRYGFSVEHETCLSENMSVACQGTTTPQPNAKALFQIQCGSTVLVTSDLYALSPAGPPFRSYQCDGLPVGTRPLWTLLGFFEEGACSSISEGFTFDSDSCFTASGATV